MPHLGDPINWAENQFLSSAKDTAKDPAPDHLDPKCGSNVTGELRTQSLQQLREDTSVCEHFFLAQRCEI